MSARTATPAEKATKVVGTAIRRGPWMHALAAFVVGAVFGYLLRSLAIAALIDGGVRTAVTALVILFAAIGFGAVGRAFTRVGRGWLLVLSVIIWAPAVLGASFFVFAGNGSFGSTALIAPLVGGIAGGVAALLAHRGVPRVLGIIVLLLAVAYVAFEVISAP